MIQDRCKAWPLLMVLMVPSMAFAMGGDCDTYGEQERAVLARFVAADPRPPADGTGLAVLEPGIIHEVTLVPQVGYPFVTDPGRHTLAEGSYAIALAVPVERAGRYRVYISDDSWVDLVGENGKLVSAEDFGGRHHCRWLRKFVAYDLKGNHEYVLQLSGGTHETMKVLIRREGR